MHSSTLSGTLNSQLCRRYSVPYHATPIWVHFGAPLKGLVEHPEGVAYYTHEGAVLEHAREHP